jgi:chromate reductase, NAD(P)H dehydrogenase (quinone)
MIHILGISGSLRAKSCNTTLLRAAAKLASSRAMSITIYSALGELPHFNPDLEGTEPSSVIKFRDELQNCGGVLISSPEYAHGVPGVLKNALDWIVGSGELVDKPVALLNASPRSTYAQASLRETVTVMSGRLIEEASVTVSLLGKNMNETDMVSDQEMSSNLVASLEAFAKAILVLSAQKQKV